MLSLLMMIDKTMKQTKIQLNYACRRASRRVVRASGVAHAHGRDQLKKFEGGREY